MSDFLLKYLVVVFVMHLSFEHKENHLYKKGGDVQKLLQHKQPDLFGQAHSSASPQDDICGVNADIFL